MAHVDAVWGRLRVPHAVVGGPRARGRCAAALTRFLAWHDRPDARTLLATEHALRGRVDARRRRAGRGCYGYADRLELDDDGRVVVVDLKTGKYRPTGPTVPSTPQLGALPARRRPRRRRRPAAGRRGSRAAPSWCSCGRLADGRPSRCRSSRRSSRRPDGRDLGRGAAGADAAALIRAETFPAAARRPLRRAAPSWRSARPRARGRCSSVMPPGRHHRQPGDLQPR